LTEEDKFLFFEMTKIDSLEEKHEDFFDSLKVF